MVGGLVTKNASLIEVGDPLVPEATHYPTQRRRKTTQILSFLPRVLEMFWQKMNLEFDFNLSLGVLVISANFSLTEPTLSIRAIQPCTT